ncbi:MAG: hypothetical protein NVSMB26_09230 [Beijerinckiaceae bacterium]
MLGPMVPMRFWALCRSSLPVLIVALGGPAFGQTGDKAVLEGRSSLGPGPAQIGPPSEVVRSAWLQRVERARVRYEAFANQARLAIHPKIIEPGAPPPATGFLNDTTLRRGDVVVTSEGLMVFRGSARFPYKNADFDPVESPAGARSRHAPELIELQHAHESQRR